MTTHVLRCDEPWFSRLADGTKTAELRRHDRDYLPGDTLVLVRVEPGNWGPSDPVRGLADREPVVCVTATVAHVLPASVFPEALRDGWSMLSLSDVSSPQRIEAGAFREAYPGPWSR